MIRSSVMLQEYTSKSVHVQGKASFRDTKLRFLALFFACMIMIGDAYCFDNPMALQSEIKQEFGIDNFKFNMLYTVYSLPNIILPFFGGVLIDKIGPRKAILLFSTIILIGQIICVVGSIQVSYWVLITGRIVFGMGSESLNVSQNSIMAQWFKNKEVSLAIGLCISIPKIGSAMNSLMSPYFYHKFDSISMPMIFGAGTLIFSYICGLILIAMDFKADKQEKENLELLIDQVAGRGKSKTFDGADQEERQVPELPDEQFDDEQLDYDPDSPNLQASPEVFQTPFVATAEGQHQTQVHEEPKEEIKLEDIAKLSGTFWILIIICMLTEALFVPFLDNGNELLQERFNFTAQQAGLFLMIPYLVAAITTPFIGYFADTFGRRSLLIIITSGFFLLTHILFLFKMCDQVCAKITLPLVILGLCFGFYASVVIPSVPIVVKPHLVGTAFGLTGVFQNTALALFPMITGILFNQFKHDENGEEDLERGYKYQSFFFVGMSGVLVFIAFLLSFVDKSGERKLSGKPKKHKKVEEKIIAPQVDLAESNKLSFA